MKNITLSISMGLLVLLAACNTAEPVQNYVDPVEPAAQVDAPTTNGGGDDERVLVISDLVFDLPEDWEISQLATSNEIGEVLAKVKLPNEDYDVNLVLEVREVEVSDLWEPTEILDSGLGYLLPGCGGPYGCYELIDGENAEYTIMVFLESDETMPVDWNDGPWTPSHNVKREEIDNFIKTARMI
ncbi:hypothetical protein KKC94_05230 [Patescibacteria group bacterium]|nr:hypothetical protein [Patescibacteria group bacterium]